MTLFLALLAFWTAVLCGTKFLRRFWRRWQYLWPVHYLSEIRSVDYYRQLSPAQFGSLVVKTLRAREFTILGDPYLGRSEKQGYIWKGGKKTVLVHKPEKPLTSEDLEGIAKHLRLARAERALVFSPFPDAPRSPHHDVEVLAGKSLLLWFSVLGDVHPPFTRRVATEPCPCGSPMNDRLNSAGQHLWVCSRFPDCRTSAEVTAKNYGEVFLGQQFQRLRSACARLARKSLFGQEFGQHPGNNRLVVNNEKA